ncbi:hypothetical protein J2783_001922 [Chryseobacterium sediminis]|nr:hypothetical protein [Chryseobacterium sediminis]
MILGSSPMHFCFVKLNLGKSTCLSISLIFNIGVKEIDFKSKFLKNSVSSFLSSILYYYCRSISMMSILKLERSRDDNDIKAFENKKPLR